MTVDDLTDTSPHPYDQLLFDLFTTAVEGGTGYWAQVDDYHLWLNSDHRDGEDLFGFLRPPPTLAWPATGWSPAN